MVLLATKTENANAAFFLAAFFLRPALATRDINQEEQRCRERIQKGHSKLVRIQRIDPPREREAISLSLSLPESRKAKTRKTTFPVHVANLAEEVLNKDAILDFFKLLQAIKTNIDYKETFSIGSMDRLQSR